LAEWLASLIDKRCRWRAPTIEVIVDVAIIVAARP
jgi:hypothetical protein